MAWHGMAWKRVSNYRTEISNPLLVFFSYVETETEKLTILQLWSNYAYIKQETE